MAKKFGDRKDGAKLRNIHAMHLVMPLMYPNRCDNEAFISERIDLTNVLAYLDEKNASDPDYKFLSGDGHHHAEGHHPAAEDEPLHCQQDHVSAQ